MTIQDLRGFYTLETLALRLNRSVVGVRTRLRKAGRLPKCQYADTKGSMVFWPIDEVEAAIAADPGLVLPVTPKQATRRPVVVRGGAQ